MTPEGLTVEGVRSTIVVHQTVDVVDGEAGVSDRPFDRLGGDRSCRATGRLRLVGFGHSGNGDLPGDVFVGVHHPPSIATVKRRLPPTATEASARLRYRTGPGRHCETVRRQNGERHT